MPTPSPAPSPLAQAEPWSAISAAYEDKTMPFFRAYAAEALRRVPADGARVLDVAAGPGTLTFLATPRARQVHAVDFAPAMLARVRATAAREGVLNVQAVVANGQSLPFANARFDRAYSMFGLIFFPDRDRGLAELRRVLAP